MGIRTLHQPTDNECCQRALMEAAISLAQAIFDLVDNDQDPSALNLAGWADSTRNSGPLGGPFQPPPEP